MLVQVKEEEQEMRSIEILADFPFRQATTIEGKRRLAPVGWASG